MVTLIAAPSSLGLRPPMPGKVPGAWRAPDVLLDAGLRRRLNPVRLVRVPAPAYDFDKQPGTRIRNGIGIREHAVRLAGAVDEAITDGGFAVVVGGDCSILLGCLAGARQAGRRCGLVHVDGHNDFAHPGNYDAGSTLGAVAGMDLALATGRGELLLTHWPGIGTPLVPDEDVVQIGDREEDVLSDTAIVRFDAAELQQAGVTDIGRRVVTWLGERGLERVWLHVDLDVLDETVLPAVDTPGRPGLSFAQLADLVATLVASGRVLGTDVTIYDPELDPDGRYAPAIVDCIASGLAPWGAIRT